jgi:hypothetical protein
LGSLSERIQRCGVTLPTVKELPPTTRLSLLEAFRAA